jgi:tRNA (guanine-N7-)-methyltransferase
MNPPIGHPPDQTNRPIPHPGTMTRSRPTIDVSSHLIEPEATPAGPPDPGPAPIDWVALFGNDHPVELEVGPGKGLFLANAARANVGRNYLGVEVSRKYARLAAERLAKQGLDNAKVWAGDARAVMARRIPDRSLRAVHVYFPDPWWKKRHKKRRVFTGALVAQIERTLLPGGELHVASDVEEYFDLIRGLIAASPGFHERPAPEPKDPEHEHDYLTNFERKYRIEGRPIYRAVYDYRPTAESS